MKRILLVFGTRPEAIKMAPLVKKFLKDSTFQTKVVVTAQHREMLDQVLNLFDITPDYDLNIMKSGQDLYDVTSAVLLGLRDVLKEFKPDLVLVHGDTTTTFSATLAAFYQQIPVGHVEAGLRTGNMYSPWPEEINRVLTTRLTKFHFAPTAHNEKTLLKEGVLRDNVVVTGNTVIDSLKWMVDKIENTETLKESIYVALANAGLNKSILTKKYVLVTGHRRENFGQGFENICKALSELAEKNRTVHFVYPVHLNPNVQEPVNRLLGKLSNVHLIAPLGYEIFVYLMKNAYLVLTDSGGVQEEAPGLGKPVLVMRNTTERQEAVMAGTVRLVGTNQESIISSVQELLDDAKIYQQMAKANNPYGNGDASQKIVDFIKAKL